MYKYNKNDNMTKELVWSSGQCFPWSLERLGFFLFNAGNSATLRGYLVLSWFKFCCCHANNLLKRCVF